MSIEHLLVCSTGHISLADNYKLIMMSNTNPLGSDLDALRDMNEAVRRFSNLSRAMSPLIVTSRPHGFFIYVPSDKDDFHETITNMQKPPFRLSTGLRNCMQRARLCNCGYLLLDGDGDYLEGLKRYAW